MTSAHYRSLDRRLAKLESQQAARRREARAGLERRIDAQLEELPLADLIAGELPAALRADLSKLRSMLEPAEIASCESAISLPDAILAAVAFGGEP